MESRANTPFFADKSFWLVILGVLLPIISKKLGVQLDVQEIAAQVAALLGFIVMSKWKSGTITAAEVRAAAAAEAQAVVAKSTTAEEAAKSLAAIGVK